MSQAPPQGQMPMLRPGATPTREQIQQIQQQLEADAAKAGLTVPQFIERIKQQQQAMKQQRAAQQQQHNHEGHENCDHDHSHDGHGHQGQQSGAQPIQPGPPNPTAIALANYLRSQDLKPRTVILNGERKDMFRVKRALRAIQSPAYEKARKKTPALPEITDRASLENCFKLLPLSMLALRVEKDDPHAGHNHPPPKKGKRVKGQWDVKIVGQQDAGDDMYYVWLYNPASIMHKVYAVLALVAIFAVVLYPLWPLVMRQGVYYLSWGFLGLLGLFFAMAIFRVILFVITYFIVPPGLWLYPQLWADVGFFDSFRPIWAWHDPNPKKKKKSKSGAAGGGSGVAATQAHFAGTTGQPLPASATTTATSTQIATSAPTQRSYSAPQVEEADDE